jgi:hypothetical protein
MKIIINTENAKYTNEELILLSSKIQDVWMSMNRFRIETFSIRIDTQENE